MTLDPLHLPLAVAFITPWFFWAGAGLVGIPILIHILNRRRFKVVPWAAMEYLLQAMRKNRQRVRFEQWLLLATRCLVLLLLGMALARPLACSRVSLAALGAQRTGLSVFVIDNGYSMAYEADRPGAKTHLDQARKLAKERIDRLEAGGESVVVISAATPAAMVLAQPTYDLAAAKAAIDRLEQSYTRTDMAGALQKALEIGREQARQPRKSLYILSDGTRCAWLGAGSGAIAATAQELARLYRVYHANLGLRGQWNQAMVDLKAAGNLVLTRFANDFVATPRGFGAANEALLQWKLDGQVLPGGGTLRIDLNTPPQTQSRAALKTGGPHVISAAIIGSDRLKIDDTRYLVVDAASELKVLIVEGDRGTGVLSGSAAFLDLALAPPKEDAGNASGKTDSYVTPELISDLELGNKVLSDYRAVILANVGQITEAQADQLQKFVQQGGTLLLFMGEQVRSDTYNQVLLPRHLMPGMLIKTRSVASDQKGFQFDFRPQGAQHPYLSAFRGEENSGLDTAQIFTYWQVELPPEAPVERVLDYLPADALAADRARKKDPAITVHSLGQGRVVFVSTTANADWTSFPAKPAYVTLMHELLSGSVNTPDGWMNLQVGQPLRIPTGVKLVTDPVLTDPGGRQVALEHPAAAADGRTAYLSPPLGRPGVYTLSTGVATIPIAVNVPPEEADVRTLDDQAIKHALGDIDVILEGDQLPPQTSAQQAGTDLGWSCMFLVLALAAAECAMAMKFGHYRRN